VEGWRTWYPGLGGRILRDQVSGGWGVWTGIGLAAVLSAQGCDSMPGVDSGLRGEVPLIAAAAWVVLEADDDPAEDRPDEVSCPDEARSVETIGGDPSLEIDTGVCDYLAVVQPLLANAVVGDRITGRIWHQALSASEEAEAHLAYSLDGEVVWETWTPIPLDAGIVLPDFELEFDAPEGTPLVFHLHNHGSNTWNVIDLNREAEDAE
jgi:hypothetical protein